MENVRLWISVSWTYKDRFAVGLFRGFYVPMLLRAPLVPRVRLISHGVS